MEYEEVKDIDFDIDKYEVIKQTIDSAFENPWQNVEETIDNAIDAQANFVTIHINKHAREITIDDNGEGIEDPKDVFKFGGNKKREKKAKNPGSVHGEFGEGVKTCLSMCDELQFESNNGNFDSWVSLKYPQTKNIKPVSYKTARKGTIRKDIGTTARLLYVDANKMQSVCDHLNEIAEKYSARLARQD